MTQMGELPARMTELAVELGPKKAEIPRVVIVDGPPGSGKTTIATIIAERYGYQSVTAGMLFCAAGMAIVNSGADLSNIRECQTVVDETRIDFDLSGAGETEVAVNGQDVTDRLFTPENKFMATKVATYLDTSRLYVVLQKLVNQGRYVVDRGVQIYPNADLKIWLTADPMVRAARRCAQLAGEGKFVPIAKILADESSGVEDKEESGR